ncbi:uncharacterized protein B0H64DRAFT_436261 [Chaetomium fimeti]|uniref:Uncharacterized protein n=1 Tax=Chaetomium fimeti TaxID=1854472 RepID=A0AAE0LN77_9PEZI|nr:hypothetical protein B0H64DRAFT_436261 [Chaetomium fimeti]
MPSEDLWSARPAALQWRQIVDGFVFVFCVKQRESFDKLVDESEFLLQLKAKKHVPLILVGGEPGYCDLEHVNGKPRRVTVQAWSAATEKKTAAELGNRFNVHMLHVDLLSDASVKQAAADTVEIVGERGID